MRGGPIVAIGAVVVAAELLLLVTDTGPNVWLVAALVALAGGTVWLATTLGRFAVRPTPAPPAVTVSPSYPDLRTTALRQALASGHADLRGAERIRERLISIIDDELIDVHGIDRTVQPDAARDVLGADLDRFVNDPDASRTLTTRGLEQLVTRIEQI
jgi:hypothetical protein